MKAYYRRNQFFYLFIYITSPFDKFTHKKTCIQYYTKIQYKTIQCSSRTLFIHAELSTIQTIEYNTRHYSTVYTSVQYNTHSTMQ